MSTSKLSVFAKPTHGTAWLDYTRDLAPYDCLILDPDIQQVSDVFRVSPETEITIRRWDWDDGRTKQNPDGVYKMLRDDPIGLAQSHVNLYSSLVAEWEIEAMMRNIPFPPRSKIIAHLVNEPDSNFLLPQINLYTIHATRGLRKFDLGVDGLNLSTGHPALLRDGEPDWSPLLGALEALEETGSYAVVHEYFNSRGIQSLVPWHILRHNWMPRGPRVKIGEFGLEELVNEVMTEHHGYQGRITDGQMLEATSWYLENVRDDVVAVRVFMTDFVDRVWRTFDTTPIHRQLVEVGKRFLSKAYSPRPVVSTPRATVNVSAGANIRSEPTLGSTIQTVMPVGSVLPVLGRTEHSGWWRVKSPEGEGWVSGAVVLAEGVESVPIITLPPTWAAISPKVFDPVTALAFLGVESGNRPFTDGLLTIRVEIHRLRAHLGDSGLFDRFFRFQEGNYSEQYWRESENHPWRHAHGSMRERHELLSFARRLDENAALLSTGMGMAQIMGENHARAGFSTPQAMFRAFSNPEFGEKAQLLGFVNYCLSSPKMMAALAERDWVSAIQSYNGVGQEQMYLALLQKQLGVFNAAIYG